VLIKPTGQDEATPNAAAPAAAQSRSTVGVGNHPYFFPTLRLPSVAMSVAMKKYPRVARSRYPLVANKYPLVAI
jgi:hypothetical protein